MSHERYTHHHESRRQQYGSAVSERDSGAPDIGSIHEGRVTRIEPYGAFVKLYQHPYSGLVHISQLSNVTLKSVEDAVSVGDSIFVKVLDCDEIAIATDDHEDDFQERRPRNPRKRFKIRLSAKYVAQDGTRTDLDPDSHRADKESTNAPRSNQSHNHNHNHRSAPPSDLENALNSQIGMGVGLDPAHTMQQVHQHKSNRIVLKGNTITQPHSASKTGQIVINGYALVDDDDDDDPDTISQPYKPPHTNASNIPNTSNTFNTSPHNYNPTTLQHLATKPMGRGRGATLPAWMTNTDTSKNNHNGPNPSHKHHPHHPTKQHANKKHHRRKYDSSSYSSTASSLPSYDSRRTKHRHRSSRSTRSTRHRSKHHTDSDTRTKPKRKRKHTYKKSRRDDRRHHRHNRTKRSYSSDTTAHTSLDNHKQLDTSVAEHQTQNQQNQHNKQNPEKHKLTHPTEEKQRQKNEGNIRNEHTSRNDPRVPNTRHSRHNHHNNTSDSESSLSRDRSKSRHRTHERKKRKKQSHKRRKSHRNGSRRESSCSDDDSGRLPRFKSVAEAQKMIEQLEERN